MDPILGEVRMIAGNFAPVGWHLCDGSLINISENDALFALIGTAYGGDGVNTFGVPDLRGRTPIHQGQGPGLSNRQVGQMVGTETVTLTAAQVPGHYHSLTASNKQGEVNIPDTAAWAQTTTADTSYFVPQTTPDTAMSSTATTPVGNSQPHENLGPFQVVTFIIATAGVFPSRN
jgi:microcystin-dependent protein